MTDGGLAEPELLGGPGEAAEPRRFHECPQVPITHPSVHCLLHGAWHLRAPNVPGTFAPQWCLAPSGGDGAWHLWWGKVPGTMVMDEVVSCKHAENERLTVRWVHPYPEHSPRSPGLTPPSRALAHIDVGRSRRFSD